MAVIVKQCPDPLTPESWRTEPVFAECYALQRLKNHIERYAKGLISGCSLLVAGHRGSGKTFIVSQAVQEIWREADKYFSAQARPPMARGPIQAKAQVGDPIYKARPILVPVHGPDLLAEPTDRPFFPGENR